jgi:hypothetical protein
VLLHLLVWVPLLTLLSLWSLGCWLAQGLLSWEGWRRAIDWTKELPPLDLPPWLSEWLGLDWLDWLRQQLVEWGPELQLWVAGLPDLGGWLAWLIGAVWVVGAVTLVLIGLVCSVAIAAIRRGRKAASAV